ncbi:MAG: family 16 glycosylhydrolase [Candidatus Hadarchaeales archaeon]
MAGARGSRAISSRKGSKPDPARRVARSIIAFTFIIVCIFLTLLILNIRGIIALRGSDVSFSFYPYGVSVYDVVQFTENPNNSNKAIVTRIWDFGDGTTSTENAPVHQYTSPGEYTVSLTLIDSEGKRETSSRKIYVSGSDSSNWVLVWSDEFNGNSVDRSKWQFELGGWGWGNNELQYYTNGGNAKVENGLLIITAKKERMGSCNYTSARLKTQGLFDIQYGRIEARLSVPMGDGLWPAFWMLGRNIGSVGWPKCGEIDIMEHINNETTIYGTMHWHYNGHVSSGGQVLNLTPNSFHVYAVEWDSSSIKWFQDGVQYYEVPIQNSMDSTEEFHQPFFIILNLAVGGNWPGPPSSNTPFPAEYKIDYVRVFKPTS